VRRADEAGLSQEDSPAEKAAAAPSPHAARLANRTAEEMDKRPPGG